MENTIIRVVEWIAAYWFCFICYPSLILKSFVRKREITYRIFFYLAISNVYALFLMTILKNTGVSSNWIGWSLFFGLPMILKGFFDRKAIRFSLKKRSEIIIQLLQGEFGQHVFAKQIRKRIFGFLREKAYGRKMMAVCLSGICLVSLVKGGFFSENVSVEGTLQGGLMWITEMMQLCYPSELSSAGTGIYVIASVLSIFVVSLLLVQLLNQKAVPILSVALFWGEVIYLTDFAFMSAQRAVFEYGMVFFLLAIYFIYESIWKEKISSYFALLASTIMTLCMDRKFIVWVFVGCALMMVLSIPKVFSKLIFLKLLVVCCLGVGGAVLWMYSGGSFFDLEDFYLVTDFFYSKIESRSLLLLWANSVAFSLSGWMMQKKEEQWRSRAGLWISLLWGIIALPLIYYQGFIVYDGLSVGETLLHYLTVFLFAAEMESIVQLLNIIWTE